MHPALLPRKAKQIVLGYQKFYVARLSPITGHLLPVPTRILLLPVPEVPAHRLQILRRLEPKLRLR